MSDTIFIFAYVYGVVLGMFMGYMLWAPASPRKNAMIDGFTMAFVVRFFRNRFKGKR